MFCGKTPEELEKLFDPGLTESDVYKINNAKGIPYGAAAMAEDRIYLNEDTVNILSSAKSNCNVTGGVFDIKLMPVIELWGFADGNYGVPKNAEIKDALKVVEKSQIDIFPR